MNQIKKLMKEYTLPLQIMARPFNGFYAMKYEEQGTLKLALFNFIMLCLSISFRSQYASIVVNPNNPRTLNSLVEFASVTAVLILFCVSNWAVSSLTDGEGRFKDIVMTVCYAMTPMILTFIPMALISNIMAYDERGFYFMVVYFAIGWFVVLVFVGLVTIHNYTATKALTTLLLTFVALLIIVFLITLLFSLLQQLVLFVTSLYTEIVFRV